MKLLETEVGII